MMAVGGALRATRWLRQSGLVRAAPCGPKPAGQRCALVWFILIWFIWGLRNWFALQLRATGQYQRCIQNDLGAGAKPTEIEVFCPFSNAGRARLGSSGNVLMATRRSKPLASQVHLLTIFADKRWSQLCLFLGPKAGTRFGPDETGLGHSE